MKFSKIRTAFLTCILGIVSVHFFNFEYEKWNEPYVELPQVVSESPIIVKVCPEIKSVEEQENIKGGYTGGGRQGEGGLGCGRKSETKPLSPYKKSMENGSGRATGIRHIKNSKKSL